ncbi:MAG: 2-oxoacid:acceptor oxidoreductase family protein [Desulfarculus sp.]|nr:2-oxoacid:acceptor oxidoreductase family protein [Desulfarculus sp.]
MTIKSVFAGFGGQGVLMMGYMLALTAMRQGKNVTYLPSYGAEVRGGTANCTVVVSDDEIASPVASSPDIAVVMNNPSLLKYANLVRSGGIMLVNSTLVGSVVNRQDLNVVKVPATDLAHELGEDRSANVVMMGAFAQATGVLSLEAFSEALADTNLGKKPKVLELNRRALQVGAQSARQALEAAKGSTPK